MLCLIKIRNIDYRGIGPKFFEIVELTCFGSENVNQGFAVVDHDPLRVAVTVVVIRFNAIMLKHILAH